MNRYYVTVMLWCVSTLLAVAESPQALRGPNGFESVRLGMSVTQLITARPNIKPFGFFEMDTAIDPIKLDQMLFESEPGHAMFDSIFYKFDGQELDTIVFAGKVHGGGMNQKIEAFLDMVVSAWGKADEALVVGIDDPKGSQPGAPALMWKKDDAIVVASHTSTENLERLGRGSVQIKIQQCTKEDMTDEARVNNLLNKFFYLPDVAADKKARMLGAIMDRVRDPR